MDKKEVKVLLIEDNAEDIFLIKEYLSEENGSVHFTVVTCESLAAASEMIAKSDIDIILLDLFLPDSRGIQTYETLAAQAPDIPVVIMTGLNDETLALEAVKKGAQDYLIKIQVSRNFLTRVLLYAIERQRIRSQLNDVTDQLKSVNEQLERLALLDPLTELLNRRGLQQALSSEIRRAQRHNASILVLIMDLDDFKKINDTFGHAVGDIVLKEISGTLKSSVRVSDHISRIGGDEFMVLFPETDPSEGIKIAEKIRLALMTSPIMLASGEIVKVSASLGLVTLKHDETPSVDELMSKTHMALHKSKQAGKNRLSYDDNEEASKAFEAFTDMKTSLRRENSFHALRQPIFDIANSTKIGYEFLSRSSIEGLEMPNDFFRVSLEANVLTFVDFQCLKACIAAGSSLSPETRRHVNLFPSTMIDIPVQHLIEAFSQDAQKGLYVVEISEQQIIGEPTYLSGPVKALKKSGVLVAIDDVGFGRSCLESLVLLEPDLVKIDKRWVNGISHDKALMTSLKRFLRVAHSLGTEVVAEGIEWQEDLELLRGLGVKYGQGYFWGRPS